MKGGLWRRRQPAWEAPQPLLLLLLLVPQPPLLVPLLVLLLVMAETELLLRVLVLLGASRLKKTRARGSS